jgi:hypothetical protein
VPVAPAADRDSWQHANDSRFTAKRCRSRTSTRFYPSGFTKAQLIDYYTRASTYLLPHVKNRPVTLKRYPDGVRAEHFYEKDAPSFTPDWVRTHPVPRVGGGPDINYIVIGQCRNPHMGGEPGKSGDPPIPALRPDIETSNAYRL